MIIEFEGAFGEANFGDDLLLKVSVDIVRRHLPSARLRIRARNCSYVGDYLDGFSPDVQIIRQSDWIRRPADAVIYAGGTQFYSFPRKDDGETRRGASLFDRVVRKVRREIYDSPATSFLGIGIGPFLAGNEAASAKVLGTGHFVSVRDEESVQFAENLGVKVDMLGADICFSAAEDLRTELSCGEATKNDDAPVGFVIRNFPYNMPGNGYLADIYRVADELRGDGVKVKFFAFSAVKDSEIIEKLSRDGFEVETWSGDFSCVIPYLREISCCRFVISSRYHGIVLSAIAGVPAIGVSLDPKVSIVCRELGLSAFDWSAPFELGTLRNMVARMRAQPPSAVDLAARVRGLSERSNNMISAFARAALFRRE